jgi:hypothetical protein
MLILEHRGQDRQHVLRPGEGTLRRESVQRRGIVVRCLDLSTHWLDINVVVCSCSVRAMPSGGHGPGHGNSTAWGKASRRYGCAMPLPCRERGKNMATPGAWCRALVKGMARAWHERGKNIHGKGMARSWQGHGKMSCHGIAIMLPCIGLVLAMLLT